jgi:hypothetical protein
VLLLIDPRVEALRNAPLNSWIALSEDESTVIASGATYEEVVRESERVGSVDPIILKTPREWSPISL